MANRKYPAIVAVHGGFHYSLDDEYFGFIERFVSEGYVVMFPEYRGSRGYGKEWYDAQEYGGRRRRRRAVGGRPPREQELRRRAAAWASWDAVAAAW